MSDITFSCPGCQQNLEAPAEYAGMQINCPTCQTAMIVPQAEPAAAPPPPPPGQKGKLSMAPSTVQHSATSTAMATQIVRKGKKPNYKLYIQLGVGAVVAGAAIYFGPQLYEKYQTHKEQAAAAAQAATNPPVPVAPPDLAADEIIKNVVALYNGLPSYSVQGESIANMDMSQINPMMKDPVQTTAKFSMLLGRPGHYRIEWEREMGPTTMKGSVWSAGKGDFLQSGGAARKMKNRDTALTTAAATSGTLAAYIASAFFGGTNNLDSALQAFSKTNNETLNGRKCYVLAGQMGTQKILFWVHKDDFLIAQAEVIMGGKIDDSALTGLTAAQKKQLQAMSKIKGNIVETYSDIETNKDVKVSDFQSTLVMSDHSAPQPTRGPDPTLNRRANREKRQ